MSHSTNNSVVAMLESHGDPLLSSPSNTSSSPRSATATSLSSFILSQALGESLPQILLVTQNHSTSLRVRITLRWWSMLLLSHAWIIVTVYTVAYPNGNRQATTCSELCRLLGFRNKKIWPYNSCHERLALASYWPVHAPILKHCFTHLKFQTI